MEYKEGQDSIPLSKLNKYKEFFVNQYLKNNKIISVCCYKTYKLAFNHRDTSVLNGKYLKTIKVNN
jgi:hypothetical protein